MFGISSSTFLYLISPLIGKTWPNSERPSKKGLELKLNIKKSKFVKKLLDSCVRMQGGVPPHEMHTHTKVF